MTWRADAPSILANAITEALEPEHMVTRFVVVLEGLQPDGEFFTASNTHDGAGPTDTLGLLGWADAMERAQIALDLNEES